MKGLRSNWIPYGVWTCWRFWSNKWALVLSHHYTPDILVHWISGIRRGEQDKDPMSLKRNRNNQLCNCYYDGKHYTHDLTALLSVSAQTQETQQNSVYSHLMACCNYTGNWTTPTLNTLPLCPERSQCQQTVYSLLTSLWSSLQVMVSTQHRR